MKITMEMVTKFNEALETLGCIFKLDIRKAVEGDNSICEIVPVSSVLLGSSILNPSDQFYNILEDFFSKQGIKLNYNNTKTIFWSLTGWQE